MKVNGNAPCRDEKEDCFAYVIGGCRCLSDTNFNGRKCPFYKPLEVVKNERKKENH